MSQKHVWKMVQEILNMPENMKNIYLESVNGSSVRQHDILIP